MYIEFTNALWANLQRQGCQQLQMRGVHCLILKGELQLCFIVRVVDLPDLSEGDDAWVEPIESAEVSQLMASRHELPVYLERADEVSAFTFY